MNARKLAKIKADIDSARRKAVTARDLIAIATALGRKEFTGRGKEPTYLSTVFPFARPIAIPKHGNATIPPGTKKNILNDLEDDWLRFKEKVDKEAEASHVEENYDYEN